MVARTSLPITDKDLSRGERDILRRYRSWRRFHNGPRRDAPELLTALPKHPGCVLVAGCQRSGTTMLTRVIAGAEGFRRFALTHDDELDAALVLAGYVGLPPGVRYCFQTTYLNERYTEYANLLPDQKLIWLLRNPYSVVYSMVYHWRHFALNRLYESCVESRPDLLQLRRPGKWWRYRLNRVEKASVAYRCKTEQILAIRKLVPKEQLLVLDYDLLAQRKDILFPLIFEFVEERYQTDYSQPVRLDSLNKADRLSTNERDVVALIAAPAYEQCRAFALTAIAP